MFFEGQHTIREIWMDGRNLPSDPVPAWYGYSVGKWDGDTLIVETIGFNDNGIVRNANGNSLSDAAVALVPDEPLRNAGTFNRFSTSDAHGKYELRGIAPDPTISSRGRSWTERPIATRNS